MYYTWPFFLNFYEFPFLTVISDHERWMKLLRKTILITKLKIGLEDYVLTQKIR